MNYFILKFISDWLTAGQTYFDEFLLNLTDTAFYIDKVVNSLKGMDKIDFDPLYSVFFEFATALIVLKFIQKGFNQYVLWTDGDPDAEPVQLLIGFSLAFVVATSFNYLYDYGVRIAIGFIDLILNAINLSAPITFADAIAAISSKGIFLAILTLVFFIYYLLLYFQFLNKGVELLILKIGVPISCVGLMDADGGVFKTYIQKFFQSFWTVIIQIALLKFGCVLLSKGHPFIGIAVLQTALSTPKLLQEFMITGGGGGFSGITSTAYHSARFAQMIRGAISR